MTATVRIPGSIVSIFRSGAQLTPESNKQRVEAIVLTHFRDTYWINIGYALKIEYYTRYSVP